MVSTRSSRHHLGIIATMKRLANASRTTGAVRSFRMPLEGTTLEKGLQ